MERERPGLAVNEAGLRRDSRASQAKPRLPGEWQAGLSIEEVLEPMRKTLDRHRHPSRVGQQYIGWPISRLPG